MQLPLDVWSHGLFGELELELAASSCLLRKRGDLVEFFGKVRLGGDDKVNDAVTRHVLNKFDSDAAKSTLAFLRFNDMVTAIGDMIADTAATLEVYVIGGGDDVSFGLKIKTLLFEARMWYEQKEFFVSVSAGDFVNNFMSLMENAGKLVLKKGAQVVAAVSYAADVAVVKVESFLAAGYEESAVALLKINNLAIDLSDAAVGQVNTVVPAAEKVVVDGAGHVVAIGEEIGEETAQFANDGADTVGGIANDAGDLANEGYNSAEEIVDDFPVAVSVDPPKISIPKCNFWPC